MLANLPALLHWSLAGLGVMVLGFTVWGITSAVLSSDRGQWTGWLNLKEEWHRADVLARADSLRSDEPAPR